MSPQQPQQNQPPKYIHVDEYGAEVKDKVGVQLGSVELVKYAKEEGLDVLRMNGRLVIHKSDFEAKFDNIVSRVRRAYDLGRSNTSVGVKRHYAIVRSIMAQLLLEFEPVGGGTGAVDKTKFAKEVTSALDLMGVSAVSGDELISFIKQFASREQERKDRVTFAGGSRFKRVKSTAP